MPKRSATKATSTAVGVADAVPPSRDRLAARAAVEEATDRTAKANSELEAARERADRALAAHEADKTAKTRRELRNARTARGAAREALISAREARKEALGALHTLRNGGGKLGTPGKSTR